MDTYWSATDHCYNFKILNYQKYRCICCIIPLNRVENFLNLLHVYTYREKWLKKLLSNIGGNIAGELFPIIGKSGGKVREK